MAQQILVETGFQHEPEHDFHAHAHAEHDALCAAIVERLRDGSLPPDEAYWWTRIACSAAMTRLSDRCRTGEPNDSTCVRHCRCESAAA
jgi:hypothetical protein